MLHDPAIIVNLEGGGVKNIPDLQVDCVFAMRLMMSFAEQAAIHEFGKSDVHITLQRRCTGCTV